MKLLPHKMLIKLSNITLTFTFSISLFSVILLFASYAIGLFLLSNYNSKFDFIYAKSLVQPDLSGFFISVALVSTISYISKLLFVRCT
jgi:hypothetical protein